jgi:hypothetical protein
MDEVRVGYGKSLKLNSLDRTKQEQAQLKAQGYRAAENSTHEWGFGADIDTTSNEDTDKLVKIIEEVSKRTGIKIRIGWKKYKLDGNTFVHLDVAPEYFGKGKALQNIKVHPAWTVEARW